MKIKIIQIISHKEKIFGLSDKGLVYILHTKGNTGNWILCTEK